MLLPFLPPPTLADHLQTILILTSMFPSELALPPALSTLAAHSSALESDQPLPPDTPLPDNFRILLSIDLEEPTSHAIEIEILFALRTPDGSFQSSPRLLMKPPAFLSRSQHTSLAASLPPSSEQDEEEDEALVERLLSWVDHLKETVPRLIKENEQEDLSGKGKAKGLGFEESEMDRVWFWLPSLSTKEKRNDIVQMAPSWNLTGFVLAGTFTFSIIFCIMYSVDDVCALCR